MNVAATSENKLPFLTALFQRWLPTRPSAQAMFWASFPVFLLLFNMGVNWLKPTPFALYLPFVALAAFPLVLRYRALGVLISYTVIGLMLFWLIPTIEPSERLWQMGIFFNLALTLYITLLTFEEIELCFNQVQESIEAQNTSVSEMASELRVLKSQAEERQQELEEEIQKLKTEAELRRIERNQLHSHLELVQSEIELLNSQKEAFINEAREARSAALAAEQQMHSEGDQVAQAELKTQELYAQVEQAQAAVTTREEHLQALKNRVSHAEEELQQKSTRLAEWEERKKLWEESALELQTKKANLEETNRLLHEEVISAQEAILLLQQKPPAIIETFVENASVDVDLEQIQQLQKALNKAHGLHAQLQSQFQDKAEILSHTRRELFVSQGKLEVIEKEALNVSLIPDREEALVLERGLNALMAEIAVLEDEISRLESLITTLIS